MSWKTTTYFNEKRPEKHPEVSRSHAIRVAESFDHEEIQPDGRIRRWGFVEELHNYVRVVIEPDGRTLHNAFIDGRFKQ